MGPIPRTWSHWGVALAVIGALVGPGGRGIARAQNYLVHDWDLDEGLPSTCMNAILRTPDGYIWLGTQQGLVRFDGVRFVTFNTANTPELGDDRITSLIADKGEGFWAGTAVGTLVKRSGGVFIPVDLENAAQGRRINAIAQTPDGTLWLATGGAGLIRFRDGQATVMSTTQRMPGPNIVQALTDEHGTLWYLTSTGSLGWVEEDQCRELQLSPAASGPIRAMARARGGGLWLGASSPSNTGARILRLQDGKATEETTSYPWLQSSERARPSALLEDDAGTLWCGTSGMGVYLRSRDGHWRAVTGELPMAQAEVLCLMPDERESIWVGTRTSGVHHGVPRPLTATHLPTEYQRNVLLTVCVRRDGSVWGGTDSAGVFCWRNSEVTRFGAQEGLLGVRIHALLEDSQTNLWAGTGAGLFQFQDNRFHPATDAALRGNVTVLYEDRQRQLWAGTTQGLLRVGSNPPELLDRRHGLPEGQVLAAVQDHAGQFWIVVAGHGLFHQTDGQFELWQAGPTTPTPWRWNNGRTGRALLPDAEGLLWVATQGHGLFCLEGDRIHDWYWNDDGLPSNHLLELLEDEDGNLWVSCENGIFSYAKKALLDYRRAGSPRPIPFRLLKADGLPYKVCSGGGQPTGTQAPDGTFWFPDGPALVSFDPATARHNVTTWPPLIEEVRVDGVSLPFVPEAPLRVGPGARNFEFVFTSPNTLAPNRLRFRHQLVGLDEDWTVEGSHRSVKYSALRPGHYTFRVMVHNPDQVWTGAEAALHLVVVPRWWERTSLRLGAAAALLGGIALTVRQVERGRSRRKLAALERERALEQERARIARDIHDDLGACLTQVALLGDMAGDTVGSPDELRAQTRQISEAAHEMARSLETIVWAVRPENDTLRSLLEYMNRRTDELFEKMPRQYQFNMPADLPGCSVHPEVRHNVFLAYKEALTNALKHAQATEFRIAITCATAKCVITVTDNGRGFEPGHTREGGTGLRNMQLRLQHLGGRVDVQSRPGQGTTVRLEFPFDRDGRT